MAAWLIVLFDIIKAIPVLDRWFQEASQQYHDWRWQQGEVKAKAALDKAQKEYDTTDLQREIGEKL